MSVADRRTTGGLGRGLASLIPQRTSTGGTSEIPIARIRRNPYQPRLQADDSSLSALAASIAQHGVLQPILVTATLDGFQLVAGERRLRAAEMAGLEHIPAIVRDVAEQAQLELALVENLQRADLNPLDEARAYRRLMDEFGLDQDGVARRVGRARSSVANTLRLLALAASVQAAVGSGAISEGHARAIAGVPDPDVQRALLATVAARALSVRQTEQLAKRMKQDRTRKSAARSAGDPDLERIEGELRAALGTRVSVTPTRRGGRITIEYYDGDDFERLTGRLLGRLP
ncbi:MAG: ParB/RepB/Spo0J family partition protein [Candidatus Limnocylindrales bacterium]